MSQKLVLYFTTASRALYRWSGGRIELAASFGADDEGLEGLRAYLKGRSGALVTVLADIAGEDFHEDQIPFLRGSDRETVVQRRLAQRYRDTRLSTAVPLGASGGERRGERLLLASFTNTQQFTPWLDAIAEAGARLSGVYSVPLLAPTLAARLGGRAGRAFLITPNATGLRQCFIDEGKLRFARLERSADLSPEAMAMFVRSETARLAQYLTTLRTLPRDGPPVQVIVVAPEGQRAAFEQALVSDARLAYHTVEMGEAARKAGIKRLDPGATCEQLYLHLAITRAPKEQFARVEDRRAFILWKLHRGILAAGAAGLAACALFAGTLWLDILGTRDQVALQRQESQSATREHQRITATFPVTQTSSDNLKAAVVQFRAIAARAASPEGALAHLSKVLAQFPQVEIEALTWSVDTPADGGGPKPAAAAQPATQTAKPTSDLSQVLEISGRVEATQRSDYRAITQQVQRFAAALTADGAYRTLRTQLPFDVTPDATLSGDIGETADRGDAPRFTIVVARRLQP